MDVKITFRGTLPASENWIFGFNGINRLYFFYDSGAAYIENGKEFPFIAGKFYFIPSSSTAIPVLNKCVGKVHAFVDFEMLPPVIYNGVLDFIPKNDKLKSAANLFLTLTNTKSPDCFDDAIDLLRADVEYIVGAILSEYNVHMIDDKCINSVLEYMHSHMSEKINIAQLAAANYLAPDSFIRKFKRSTGMTPYRYLKTLRVRMARYLILHNSSLEDAASKCGYSDASSLLHAIKSISKE